MSDSSTTPRVVVLMPTFDRASFIARAVASLIAQRFGDWQLIVVDDGSTDATTQALAPFLGDPRITVERLERNGGLGAALNRGLALSTAPLVAYLPSDDVWYADHLETLVSALDANPDAAAATSGVRHHYNREVPDVAPGEQVQLVQMLHRRIDDRWIDRAELTTDDLDVMYWGRVRAHGAVVATGLVTCEWVDHPDQRHKIVREPIGGINTYRQRYGVREPLIFKTTQGHRIDEDARYREMRGRSIEPAADGLKILMVGELAYNPERVLALAERGHRLYGLWMDQPYWYNWTGPLPFGHVEDLPRNDWQAAVRRVQPDVIYALLNWQTIPFAHHVMKANPGVPFIWHFKEGPFIALDKGMWRELLELFTQSDGRIYSSDEMRDWFATVRADTVDGAPVMVLDGDLPKRDWLQQERVARLSDSDGEIHTVVPGRPIGLHPETVAELAANKVHLHFYGEFTHGQWRAWIERAKGLAGRFLHLHANVDQENWVTEFSRYDAGWLHFFASGNHGEMTRANWDDLNIPARIATLAAAGLPMIQRTNTDHIVAIQRIANERRLGIDAHDMTGLAAKLQDRAALDIVRENVWAQREYFMFDTHVDGLVAFFRSVIEHKR